MRSIPISAATPELPGALVVSPASPFRWRIIAALIFALGLSGLAGDHFGWSQPRVFNLHLLFGLALAWGIAARLVEQRRALAPRGTMAFVQYIRRLTRWVYVLLYVLAGVRICLRLFDIMASSSAAHANLDDFQVYVAYGVIPLWVIRFIFLHPRRAAG